MEPNAVNSGEPCSTGGGGGGGGVFGKGGYIPSPIGPTCGNGEYGGYVDDLWVGGCVG